MTMRAAKRGASSDLNHENWNQEDEAEDAGTFESAGTDVISRRKIRVARRRGSGTESAGTGGLFKSFTGFAGSTGLAGASVPSFNFGADKSGDSKRPLPSFGGFGAASKEKSEEAPAKAPVFQFGAAPSGFTPGASTFSFRAQPIDLGKGPSEDGKAKLTAKLDSESAGKEEVSSRDRHLHMLRSLNLSVNKWISSHVDKDPYCDLTPVFADYEKHLREIESKHPYNAEDGNETLVEAKAVQSKPAEVLPANGKDSGPSKSSFSFFSQGSITPTKSLGKPPTVALNFGLSSNQLSSAAKESDDDDEDDDDENEEEEEEAKEPEKKKEESKAKETTFKPFSFAMETMKKPQQESEEKKEEEEKEEEEKKPAATMFSGMNFKFGSLPSAPAATPFSFDLGSVSKPAFSMAASSVEKEEEDYVPPKAETKDIKEEGAVLTKRCKLYYNWEDSWHDKGVGNLHLKPIENSKLQAIIRADTNLGNILLNVMLTKVIPITRNKNNLTLLCVPSPPMRPVKPNEEAPTTPMPLLVRFKTEAESEEVLKEIERLRADS